MSLIKNAAETIGTLTDLDTLTPTLYLDYPQGRIKCPGAVVYTASKFISFQLSRSGMVGVVWKGMEREGGIWWCGRKGRERCLVIIRP